MKRNSHGSNVSRYVKNGTEDTVAQSARDREQGNWTQQKSVSAIRKGRQRLNQGNISVKLYAQTNSMTSLEQQHLVWVGYKTRLPKRAILLTQPSHL